MKFSTKDISDYYDQTQIHYYNWWKLKDNLSLHFGLWFEATPSFEVALHNTNREMAKIADVRSGIQVLDAGCGVGGGAFYLAQEHHCTVHGITLSQKQLSLAESSNAKLQLNNQVQFSQQDFLDTQFENESFDLIWACESSCHAASKTDFLKEASRLLKPGGRVIISDYFLTSAGLHDEKKHLRRWADLWAIDQFYTWPDLSIALGQSGLQLRSKGNYTTNITPSAKKMFRRAQLAAFFSEFYNLFHNTSRFAKHHYRSAWHQYKALKNQDWEYWIICLEKAH